VFHVRVDFVNHVIHRDAIIPAVYGHLLLGPSVTIGGGGWGSLQRPCPVLPAADALDQRSVEVVGRRVSPPAISRGAVSADGWLRRRAVMRGAAHGDPHRHRLPALVRWLVTPFHPRGGVCVLQYRAWEQDSRERPIRARHWLCLLLENPASSEVQQ
jgi:hypothetical protein